MNTEQPVLQVPEQLRALSKRQRCFKCKELVVKKGGGYAHREWVLCRGCWRAVQP